MGQTGLICRFEESWPQLAMHRQHGIDELLGNGLDFFLCFAHSSPFALFATSRYQIRLIFPR